MEAADSPAGVGHNGRKTTMVTGMKYRTAAAQLLAQAREELARGDVRQASEKGWGAAAQAVKAVAEERGWGHRSHYALFEAVRTLVRETGNEDLDTLFHVANSLHNNFYEDWMPEDSVRSGLDRVAEFVGLMGEVRQTEQCKENANDHRN